MCIIQTSIGKPSLVEQYRKFSKNEEDRVILPSDLEEKVVEDNTKRTKSEKRNRAYQIAETLAEGFSELLELGVLNDLDKP